MMILGFPVSVFLFLYDFFYNCFGSIRIMCLKVGASYLD